MTANIGQISNPSILINPSPRLKQYLGKCGEDPIPNSEGADFEPVDTLFAVTENDRDFIGKFKSNSENCHFKCYTMENTKIPDKGKLLSLKDINNLYKSILKENKVQDKKIYLHELLEGSQIILPQNKLVPRSKTLQQRCKQLNEKENNRIYNEMTKNVESAKKCHPDDSIKNQLDQMNKTLIIIFQFILSLAAGFLFGFTGIELITRSLDLGIKLILGIICASTIALADLYFLAKKLQNDIELQSNVY
nr:unnamed protein product [Callosobruchus chinensis]